MGSYITLDIELQTIKDFLSKTLEGVDAEVAIICGREETGEYRDLDEFSNALFVPMEREAIAIRAVFCELNAFIEWELCNLALEAYRDSERYATTPKFLRDVPIDKTSNIKSVYNLSIGKVCWLIRQYYEVDFSDLPGFTEVKCIRQAVNAFKHRKGFKDLRRDPRSKLGERFQLTRENVYQAIDGARSFLRALLEQIKRNQFPRGGIHESK